MIPSCGPRMTLVHSVARCCSDLRFPRSLSLSRNGEDMLKSHKVMLRSWKVKTYWIQLTQALESLL